MKSEQKLESLRSSFLCEGSSPAIRWNKVCDPDEGGGLGLRAIFDLMKASNEIGVDNFV